MGEIESFVKALESYKPRIRDLAVIVVSKEAAEICDRINKWGFDLDYAVLFVKDHSKYVEVNIKLVDPWYASSVEYYELFRKHVIYSSILIVVAEFNRREEAPVLYKIIQEYRKRVSNGKVLAVVLVPGPGAPIEVKALTYSWIIRVSNENLVDAIITISPRRLAEFIGLSLDGEYVYRYSGLGELLASIVSGKALFLQESPRWKDSKIWILAGLTGASIPLYNGLKGLFQALELGTLMSPWTWEGDAIVLVARAEPRATLRYDDLKLALNEWINDKFRKLMSMNIDYSNTRIGSVRRINLALLERLPPTLVDKVLGYLKKAYNEYRRSLLLEEE